MQTEAESVLESFLGGGNGPDSPLPDAATQKPAESAPSQARTPAPPTPHAASIGAGIRPVALRVPAAPQVEVGVDQRQRVCLIVRMDASDLRGALAALDTAETWLRSSPDEVAVAAVSARLDLSRGVRRHVVTGDCVAAAALRRAGIEVWES